jgi:hypothetical protein
MWTEGMAMSLKTFTILEIYSTSGAQERILSGGGVVSAGLRMFPNSGYLEPEPV